MSISFGSTLTVDANGNDQLNITTFDATNGVQVYEDAGTLYARYIAISGATLTTPVARVSVDASFTDVRFAACRVSATSILIVYQQGAASVARLITLSGTTLTVQSTTTLTEVAINPSLSPFSATHILLAYKNNATTFGRAVTLTFSGNTVVENALLTFSDGIAAIFMPDCTTLTATKAVVSWNGQSGAVNPLARVLTLSGTTLSNGGSALQLDGANVGYSTTNRRLGVAAFSTTLIMFAYRRLASTVVGAVLTEDGAGGLSQGAITGIAGGSPHEFDIRNLDSTTAIYVGASGTNLNASRLLRSGTTFTVPDTDVLAVGSTAQSVYAGDISATQIIAGWDGTADAAVITVSATSKIWKRSSAGAWADIGDAAWTDPVRAIYVKPGLDDDTIWAAVGAGIYRTDNGGTLWTLKATLTFEPEGIDGLPADDSVIAYTKDTGGTNRVALIADTTITYRDSGHSTTGEGSSVRGVA